MRQTNLMLKRFMDLSVGSAALMGFTPLMAGVAVLVALTMGRPVLFRQTRPGLAGKPFSILKFRTMLEPRAGDEAWFRHDAERLTWVGGLLRKTSIDELPELINVLRGEMSLVGPRPLLMEYLPKYTKEEMRRHEVKPGITGWAQVNGRQLIPFSERLRLDVWYVDNWSLALDLKILLRTLRLALSGTGVRSGQELDNVDDIGLSADRERRKTEGAAA